jgi:exopolysaccharide biosynthesis protein
MNIKTYTKYIIVIILLSFAVTSFTFADNGALSVVKGLRIENSDRGIRMTLDVINPPEYQLRALEDASEVFIDIFDAEIAPDFSTSGKSADGFLENLTIDRPNFRQVTLKLQFPYGIPAENVRTFILKNPDRIIIEVDRNIKKVRTFQLTKNIQWTQREQVVNNSFTLTNDLLVNHKSPDVKVNIELAKNSGNPRETVASMVARTGAVAGINGGYFGNDGENLGLVVIDGKIVAPSVKRRPPRTAFGIDAGKNVFFDRVIDKDGKLLTVVNKMWESMTTVLGGGPRLLTNGQITVNAEEEALGKGGNDITRSTGRTALGMDKNNNLVLTTISSYKDNHKSGVKLPELANHLKSRGAVNALNLDGGGSTEMSVLGTIVSTPPGGGTWKRPVTNAVLVYDKNPVTAPFTIKTEPSELILPADGKTTGMVKIIVTDKMGNPVPNGTEISVGSNTGIFRRKFHSLRGGVVDVPVTSLRAPGTYRIKINCGAAETYLPLKLTAGESSSINVKLTEQKILPVPEDDKVNTENQQKPVKSKRFSIEALVRDNFKNGLKGKSVNFSIAEGEGTFGVKSALTEEGGVAKNSFEMTSESAKIQIATEGVSPVIYTIEAEDTGEKETDRSDSQPEGYEKHEE